ncbi:PAS domain-containing protein [Streptomyces fradiae]|uniref:PAS domain-containing protein n=1 Tax=Streptomyces fradiae TaxID=1906 RepID=UPI003695A972
MSSRPSRGAARLAAILDALPDGLVLVNTNGTVVNANTIALEMFETPGTALVGRGLLDLLPAFDSRLIPGSMRRPEGADSLGRTKPTRMVARRTDGGEFPVEVTSAGLEDGREAYDSYGPTSYSGDELLMIVVRDLSGTVDTEAELARSQRQTEMILRAASEGVVGTDTDGRIVLVNPAAAQILGWRASDLGGKELHPLMLHSRADGEPFPYDESPLADTLRSGRKHRVRGQVVWAKDGSAVPVDLTTAPVRDGDQLVGAVMTFADRRPYEQLAEEHADRLAALAEKHEAETARLTEKHEAETAGLAERHRTEAAAYEERLAEAAERYESLAAHHRQLAAVLGGSLRGPLEELRRELGTLAADPAGQLWPEANQILHHLAAGYARMTTLVDNVLGFQRLDTGEEELRKEPVLLDAVVASGLDGAVELIGPGRAQFAVHAPPIEAEVDGVRLATALAHLVADVAGVDSTGKARIVAGGGYADSTVVVAAAQRGEVVRIEVRGPYAGGDPVHEPIVRGIVRAHGGVLQTHEVPGMNGSAYVLEVPLGAGGGTAPTAAAGSGTGADAGADAAGPGAASPAGGAAGGGSGLVSDGATGGGPAGVAGPAPDGASSGGASSSGTAAGPAGVHAGASAGDGGVPGGSGVSGGSGAVAGGGAAVALPAQQSRPGAGAVPGAGADEAPPGGGRRRARRASTDAFLDSPVRAEDPVAPPPTGRRRAAAPAGDTAGEQRLVPAQDSGGAEPTGRRRGRPSPVEAAPAEGSVVTAAESAQARPVALGDTVPPQGVAPAEDGAPGGGRRARRGPAGQEGAVPALPPAPVPAQGPAQGPASTPAGRRARRALATGQERATGATAEGTGRAAFALPPAEADRAPVGRPAHPAQAQAQAQAQVQAQAQSAGPEARPAAPRAVPQARIAAPVEESRHDAVRTVPGADHTPPQPHPMPIAPHAPVPGAPVPGAPMPGAPVPGVPAASPAIAVPSLGGPEAAGGIAAPATETTPGASVPPGAGAAPAIPVPPGPPVAPGDTAVPPGTAGAPVPPGTPGAPVVPEAPAVPVPPGVHPAAGTAAPGSARVPAPAGPAGTAGPSGTAGPAGPTGPGDTAPRRPGPAAGAVTPEIPPSAAEPSATAPASPPAVPTGRRRAVAPPAPAGPAPPAAPGASADGPAAEGVPADASGTQGRAFSVRTLGQGVPFTPPSAGGAPTPAHGTGTGSGRRRKLATPPDIEPQPSSDATAVPPAAQQAGRPPAAPRPPAPPVPGAAPPATPQGTAPAATPPGAPQPGTPQSSAPAPVPHAPSAPPGQQLLAAPAPEGRAYEIGAPDEGADEGPEPLDGPSGAVEVANQPQPRPVDDELPPEPLDNPRRLLVWPAPDVDTQQALTDRGYRPVIVHSREEVDAQIAAFPAALFVDPLTGPITRTALQSLRQAAVAAEVPVLLAAGLGQATREAAYGADPAVLLKALAPRDSEQHPSRVLLIEEHDEIAHALTAALERRGMRVQRAAADSEAVALATQLPPNLVVMDLMQVRRRRAGIIDWLRANGHLNRTPLVVYTSAGLEEADLPRLASGETVLFLAERSTSPEVQSRIVDLLAKIGTN